MTAKATSTPTGSLIADVVKYRRLRTAGLTGSPLSAEQKAELSALELQLRAGGAERERRESQRFHAAIQVTVIAPDRDDGEELPATLLDVGAGGAKVRVDSTLRAGERALLYIPVTDGFPAVRFECRVTWSQPTELGLTFAGSSS